MLILSLNYICDDSSYTSVTFGSLAMIGIFLILL